MTDKIITGRTVIGDCPECGASIEYLEDEGNLVQCEDCKARLYVCLDDDGEQACLSLSKVPDGFEVFKMSVRLSANGKKLIS